MRIDVIRFRNFRCFEKRGFDLAPRFNLLVGDNGTGKTSILNGLSIAVGSLFLGLPEPAEPTSLTVDVARTETFWNSGKPNVEAQFPVLIDVEGAVDGKPVPWERELKRRGGKTTWAFSGALRQHAQSLAARVARNKPVVLPALGYYGTGRIWKQKKFTRVKTTSPASRFLGYLNCLDPASDEKRLLEWFKTRELVALQQQQSQPDLEGVREAIRCCVPDADEVFWDFAADQLAIRFQRSLLWFRQLSDGYRNMLGMVADIAERRATLNPHLGKRAARETPGIVLIDEIDLHLHPRWQKRVVEDLLGTFPKVQFVATTHSPFIIQSLPVREGVQLVNLDDATAKEFANRSIEDIAEDVQGVAVPQRSQRDLDMMNAAEAYYRALERSDPLSAEEMQRLKDRLDALASRFSDDPAYHAILKVERESRAATEGPHYASG